MNLFNIMRFGQVRFWSEGKCEVTALEDVHRAADLRSRLPELVQVWRRSGLGGRFLLGQTAVAAAD